MKHGFFVRRLRGFSQICFGQIHLRESVKSADAFRVQSVFHPRLKTFLDNPKWPEQSNFRETG
jgi:hypothetical protein